MIDGVTGFTADQSPDDLAAKALTLLAAPELAARMGDEGRSLVVSSASVETMVRGYEQLIRGIYDSKTKRTRSRVLALKEPQDTLKEIRS